VFRQDEVVIGRVPGNDIVLDRDNVARRHAMIAVRADGTAVAVDLNSTNGTWLNGDKLGGPTPMHVGDKLYVGDFIVMLEHEPERAD
jgi:pilus assembly protein CpaF